jgi:hypothetical protein
LNRKSEPPAGRNIHRAKQHACSSIGSPCGAVPLDTTHASNTDVLKRLDQHLVASGVVPCLLGIHIACIWRAGQPPPDCATKKFWPLSEYLSVVWAAPQLRALR